MRLYAKMRSERAEKGQGGNQFIVIDLTVGDAKDPIDAGRITMKTTGNVFWIEYHHPHKPGETMKDRIELFQFEKGNRHDPRTCENSVPCQDCEIVERGLNEKGKRQKGEVFLPVGHDNLYYRKKI